MKRYELRRWTDHSNTEYVVRQASDDLESIQAQYERAQTASSEPELIYIVDTLEEEKEPKND